MPTAIDTHLQHYLSRYSEPEAAEITPLLIPKQYQHCIIIPCYNETAAFIQRLINSELNKQLLIIVIINQPDNDIDESTNQLLWDTLSHNHPTLSQSHVHCQLQLEASSSELLLVNRFLHKIPEKQGVGLARKIGADIACQLIVDRKLQTTWLHHTDADTHLPNNYFSALNDTLQSHSAQKHTQNISAAIYCYRHISEDKTLLKATQYYEKALHYYVSGLKDAHSPYAYHTLGSCIATQVLAYCQARGFPKRAGGEDFYLLNKLRKLGDIVEVKNSTLLIDARLSSRVPFGTGPAVEKIIAMDNPDQEYLYYHPQVFIALAEVLSHFNTLHEALNQQHENNGNTWLESLSQPAQQSLQKIGIEQLLTHLKKQSAKPQQCLRFCHDWLDGFRTLKLIHQLSEHYPQQALMTSLNL